VLERGLVDKRGPRRKKAQAIATMCIGGMIVARTVVDQDAANELRRACTEMALELGGWSKRGRKK
jgi:TetR/AcrR family transcriptional repressor of nem operon